MFEMILAGAGLVVCAALLVRQALRPSRRARLDSTALYAWLELRNLAQRVSHLRQASDANKQTRDAIDRARKQPPKNEASGQGNSHPGRRKDVDRDGNVYRPDSFKPKPPSGRDKLH